MARPEILFPLFAEIDDLTGVGPKLAQLFGKLGCARVVDLLLTAPSGVVDRRMRSGLADCTPGEVATLRITVGRHRAPGRPGGPFRVVAEAEGGALELVYFRVKDAFVGKLLPPGEVRVISGRVDLFDHRLQMVHPDHVLTEAEAAELPPYEPVYPLTQGLTQRQVAKAMAAALDRLPDLPEWVDPGLKAERRWPDWAAALRDLHQPQGPVGLHHPARQRLAYDEMLSHQMALVVARERMRKARGPASIGDGHLRAKAAAAFGFPPTGAQARALAEIEADMAQPERMLRLLQGDVGAGKTWVALMALLIAVEAGGQGALMAPTEILARQHFAGLTALAEAAGVDLILLTGRDRGAVRAEKLAAIAEGRAGIVVGTHALISGDVAWRDLRLAVIDEQHRFGVRQRMELTRRAPAGCDVLVMSATPIPRSLALAGYGDLDLSVLDEKPPGRQPIDTRLISAGRYDDVVARLRVAIAEGRRAYWVCPLVEESDVAPMVAAETRARALAAALGPEHVGLIHGQLPAEEKDAAMAAFREGRTQVLVATIVIEVGVDVPEATIMVIEQAEHFGLAQLHQLRGRVGRGQGRSACLLMHDEPLGETARARLQVMRETEDGFRIAEEDLKLRGAGDLLGHAQSGLPKFRLADLERDGALMETARSDARAALERDADLASDRGKALTTLLYLMERDESVRLLKSG